MSKLLKWWRTDRHIATLSRQGFVVVTAREYIHHGEQARDINVWMTKSGCLKDGSMPRHTRKKLARAVQVLTGTIPAPLKSAP